MAQPPVVPALVYVDPLRPRNTPSPPPGGASSHRESRLEYELPALTLRYVLSYFNCGAEPRVLAHHHGHSVCPFTEGNRRPQTPLKSLVTPETRHPDSTYHLR